MEELGRKEEGRDAREGAGFLIVLTFSFFFVQIKKGILGAGPFKGLAECEEYYASFN